MWTILKTSSPDLDDVSSVQCVLLSFSAPWEAPARVLPAPHHHRLLQALLKTCNMHSVVAGHLSLLASPAPLITLMDWNVFLYSWSLVCFGLSPTDFYQVQICRGYNFVLFFFFNLPSHLFFSHYFLLVSLWYFSFCYLGLSKYYILRTGEWKILGDKSINQQKCLQEFQEKCLLLSSYAKLPFKQIPEGDSWLFQQLAFFNYKCSSGN